MAIEPNNQVVFRVYGDDFQELGEMFEGLSVDDVLDGMEGQQHYAYVHGSKVTIGFDRTRNAIAILDDNAGTTDQEALELVKKFAAKQLSCNPANADKDEYIAICDGNTYSFSFWG